VLKRHVNPGDPVVPLTSYQAGTPLMTMADMGTLMFKGTVDEIDVGKLKEGLPVRIKIGALPDATVTGRLTRIAPKATEKEGTTLFDVEAAIENPGGVTLRAGYSANADVVIQEKSNVLLLPERLVTFEKEKAFVEVPGSTPEAQPAKKEIKTGLSTADSRSWPVSPRRKSSRPRRKSNETAESRKSVESQEQDTQELVAVSLSFDSKL
jgi:HlyD family secretion protein